MADGDRHERIEIELTSHVPTADRAVVTEVSDPTEPTDPTIELERTKLWIGAATIGLLALLVGFVVGRAGTSSQSATDAPPSPVETADSPSTTLDEALTSIDAPTVVKDLEPPPTTTSPRRTTTTIAAQPSKGVIAVDDVLADHDFGLMLLTSRGDLVEIDVATGSTVTRETGQYMRLGQSGVVAGDDWVLIPDYNGGNTSTLVLDDGTIDQVATGQGWTLLHQPGTDLFWRTEELNTQFGPMVEIDATGELTGREIEVIEWPIAVDPGGGVVVAGPNGSYLIEPEGTRRLASGAVIALGTDRMLVYDCDEELVCSYVVVDRATGAERTLDVSGLTDQQTIRNGGWAPAPMVLNAPQDAVIVLAWERFGFGQPARGVLDLETGEFTAFDFTGPETSAEWTPDGRLVLFIRNGSLHVFDPATDTTTEVFGGDGNISAFAIRPQG